MSKMLTTAEAATELGMDVRTVAKFLRTGILSGQRFGRAWMISEDEVERYQKERIPRGRPPLCHRCGIKLGHLPFRVLPGSRMRRVCVPCYEDASSRAERE